MPWLWSLIGGRVGRYFSPRNPLSVQQLEDRTAPALTGGAATEIRSFFPFDLGFRGGVSVATGDVTGDGTPDIVAGAGPGGGPAVSVYDGRTGALARSFFAYSPGFAGGVSVAVGDVTGDGTPDIVTGAGAGGGPQVKVFDGVTGAEVRSFFPFDPGFRGGVSVAVAGGRIVVGAGAGGGPNVKVFDGTGAEMRSLMAFEPWFRGGVNVASADVTGDGVPDVVAAAGPGGGPRVSVFDGVSGDRVRDLFAFDKGFAGGVNVSAADLNGDGMADLIVGAGSGGGPHVKLLDGATGGELGGLFAFGLGFNGGVRVAAADLNGDGAPELIAAAGPGGGPHVKVFELADAVGAGNFPSDLAGWDQSIFGGSGGGKGGLGVVDGILTMREGNSFRVGLSKAFTVPDTPAAVRVTYETPNFDTASTERIKDAFEVAVLGADGSPLALPVAPQRDASLNWTEQLDPIVGADADQSVRAAVNKVTINLSALPAGTAAKLVLRLVNNDTDNGTTVRVRRVDFISATTAAAAGRQLPAERVKAATPPDLTSLSDVTPSARFDYGRTTLTDQQSILTADVGVRNAGTYPMAGRLVVAVGNLSDPSVGVLDPDGYTPDGRPFFDFTPELNGTVLLPGRTTAARTLRFTNPNRERFTYELQVLAGLGHDPVFTTDPVTLVQAGKAYQYPARAAAPDGRAITYSLAGGPRGMTVNPATGDVTWATTSADLGNHTVRLRATDPLGRFAEQAFTLGVRADIPNRPPVITSNPPTDAAVAGAWEVRTVGTGSGTTGLAAADFGTGKVSLVAVNGGDQTLSVLGGLGGGKFGTQVTQRVGEPAPSGRLLQTGTPVDIGLPATFDHPGLDRQQITGYGQADFNGDSTPDLVTALHTVVYNAATPGGYTYSNYVTVAKSNGDGTFAAPLVLPLDSTTDNSFDNYSVGIITGDFNGDGKQDILGLYGNSSGSVDQFIFWRGRGDGTFDAPVRTDTGSDFVSFRAADFDGDGKLDLLVERAGQHRAGILKGNGDGTFGPYTEFVNDPSAGFYNTIGIGSLHGQSVPDVVLNDFNNSRLNVFLNDGAGHLTLSTTLNTNVTGGNGQPLGNLVGDFTGSGHGDIVFWAYSGSNGGGAVGTFKGAGDGNNFTYVNANPAGTYFPQVPTNNNLYSPVDLNGDGKPDLVLGHAGNERGVEVGLNNGDGTFAFTDYQLAADPSGAGSNLGGEYGILAGDYNRDGVMDLAVETGTSGSATNGRANVTILYGNTPGTFSAPTAVTTQNRSIYGGAPYFTLIGDVNGDGIPDLVTADNAHFYTSLGKGDGTFGPPLLAGSFDRTPTDGFLTDLNHDGKLDIVWTGTNYFSNNGGYGAALGNGDGTFSNTYSQDAGNFYGATVIQAGDFNGDGYTDFAAFNPAIYAPGTATFENGFYDVFLYDPAHPGTFTRSYHKVIPPDGTDDNTRRSFTVGDFNGDGKLDLVSIFPSVNGAPMQLLFFKGNGDGTFADPTGTPVFGANYDSQYPKWMAAADLNGDGKLDLVVTDAYNRMAVLLGHGDGIFGTPTEYSSGVTFTTSRQVYLTDIDGDGHPDFVAIDNRYGSSGNHLIAVRHGNGDGTFGPEELYNSPGTINSLAVGDVNGDGVPDVVADVGMYGGGYSLVFLGRQQGLTAVTTADVTGEGKPDVIATNFSNDRVKILAGNGDGTFARRTDLVVGRGPVAVATVADPNGRTDILTANRLGRSVTLLRNLGGGNFTRTDIPVGKALVAMAVGDVTGDGLADVVVADDGTNALYLLAKDGSGRFRAPVAIPLGDRPNAVAIGDVTGDGIPDLVVSLPNSKRVMILPGLGNGLFAAPVYVGLSSAAGGVAVADFNADGKGDIAVTLPGEGKAAVLFARGSGLFSRPQTITVGKTPTAITTRDVDGDGRPDLLVSNAGDGTANVILNKFDPTKLYRYTITATDPDGDPLTFALTSGPGGMVLNPTTGEVVWAPTADQLGANPVTITVSDGRGGTATQTFTIAVAPAQANAPPVFVTTPPATVDSSSAFNYNAKAIDANGDTLRYRLVSGPTGAAIDPITGAVSWDPRNPALRMNNGSGFDTGQVILPDSPALRPPSFAAEGWFRFDNTTNNQVLINKHGPNGNSFYPYSFALRYQSGLLRAQIGWQDSLGNNVDASADLAWTPTAGRWYHLAMTFDDATGVIDLFLNGKVVATRTVAGHITYDASPVRIGAYENGADPLIGAASNVRLWAVARTEAEIQATIASDVPANAPGLLFDLRFRDGDAVTLRDSSVNHNDGRRGGNIFPVPVLGMADPQTQSFTIRVEDGKGGFDLQTFTVNVVPPMRRAITGTVTQTGGGPLGGWVVFVDANGNGYRDAGEPYATTATDGSYTLPNLLTGDYTLSVEPRAGFVTPSTQTATVGAFADGTANFAVAPLPLGQIRGTVTAPAGAVPGWMVFLDANGNGVRDDGEPTATTDVLGRFAFTGLSAGSYTVRLDPPSGWKATTPAAAKYTVVLAANGTASGNDFTVAAVDAAGGSRPRFVTTPSSSIVARSTFRYSAVALDPAGRTVTYSLALAPVGMVIDPATGFVSWTSTLAQVGPHQVVVKVANDLGGVDLQAFTVTVAAPNTAPLFSSTPPAAALVGVPFRYDVFAQDAEQPALTFALDTAPAGATIDAASGRLTWTPTAAQLGPQAFTVVVRDGVGGETRQAFRVGVSAAGVNHSPTITELPRLTARATVPYTGRLTASDPDGDPLSFALVSGPSGLTVSAGGFVTWTPTAAQFGSQAVTASVSDGRGGTGTTTFTITVGIGLTNAAPVITSTPPQFVTASSLFAYAVTLTDADNDPVAFRLLSAPAGMSLDTSRGTLRWQPAVDQLGPATVSVKAFDPFGGETTQTFTVTVRGADGPPLVTSVPPTDAAVGSAYLYSVKAVDVEGDPLVFSLLQAPAGMTVNPVTGEIAWTPAAGQVGQQAVIIQVSNGAGGYTTQGFAVTVLSGPPNRPPVFDTDPPLFASVGTAYTFTAHAADPEGQAVTYQLRTGPAGLTVDATTGVVTWTPIAGQEGTQVVTIAAFDPSGAAGLLSFEMSVLATDRPPAITSTAPGFAYAGAAFRYDVTASNPDAVPLTFTLLNAPAGMSIDAFGRITWATTPADVGPHTATVRVTDPRGGGDEQTFGANVVADTVPPRVVVIPGQTVVRANTPDVIAAFHLTPDNPSAIVRVAATDNVGVVSLTVTANGKPVVPAADGTVVFHFADWGFGAVRVVATAADAAGNVTVGRGAFAFAPYGYDAGGDIRDPGSIPTTGVTAVITSPSDGDQTGGFVSVRGTATSNDFTGFTLSYRRADQSTYTPIAAGASKVSAGVLGKWDTTLLENGEYVLRLEEHDDIIGTTATEVTVGVSGSLKLGNFRLSFADLTIPVAGLPITLARTYDTLTSGTAGDLGYGWRLEYRDAHLQTGLPKSGLEDVGIYTAFRPGVKVYLTLPGGERQGFTFTPDLRALPSFGGQPLVIATPRFTPDRGVTSTLSVGSGGLVLNPFNELTTLGGIPWNPADPDFGGGFTLTLKDGTQFFIDGTTGLMKTANDRNGNRLTFGDAGITSTSGVGVKFDRDARGRIVGVTDPAGNTVRYTYDSRGDLTRVTDRMGNVTKFTYRTDRPHYLDSVIDPLGRTGAKALYDANGRLVGTVNANGNSTSVAYDPDHQVVTATGPLGAPVVSEYDSQGNVITSTDALGRTTRYAYDGQNRLISTTSPDGHTTASTYDAVGNETSRTTPDGATQRWTYGAYGDLLTSTDQLGSTVNLARDDRGNVLARTDADGNTTRTEYDARGLRSRDTDAAGFVTTYAYDAAGRLTTVTLPDGSAVAVANDNLGRAVQSATTTDLGTGTTRAITVQMGYDANGQQTSLTDPLGNTFAQSYTAAGAMASRTDALGRTTAYQYDAAGGNTGVTLPDGSAVTKTLNAAGQPTQAALPGGRTFSYSYDASGAPTALTSADGSTLAAGYDANGRPATQTDLSGVGTSRTFDAMNRVSSSTDAAGNVTAYAYDLAGRLTSQTDPLGRQTRYEYDPNGQLVKATLPDGGVWQFVYDSRGNRTQATDPVGNVTRYEYDSRDRLAAVTDPAGGRTVYAYNTLGLMLARTDARGHTTRFEYDARGYKTAEITPLGGRSTYEYDAVGRLTRFTNAAGDSVSYEYTTLGRLAKKSLSSGEVFSYTYRTDGLIDTSTDARGTARYGYDANGHLATVTQADGKVISYTYDPAGRPLTQTTSAGTTRYGYDTAGRLRTVTDADGGVTTYTYDAAGRVVTVARPDGTTETRTYDPSDRVARLLTTAHGATLSDFRYEYDLAGRQTKLTEVGVAVTVYGYDGRGELVSEARTPTGGPTATITYTYDAVGNRIAVTDAAGTTFSTYDAADRLVSTAGAKVVTYTYDAAGRLVLRNAGPTDRTAYTWNAENRLVRTATTTAGGTSVTTTAYDANGFRVRSSIDGTETRYLNTIDTTTPQVVEEYAADGTTLASYTTGGDLLSRKAGGTRTYYHVDADGNVRYLTNSGGAVVAATGYTAFGVPTAATGQPYQFAGEPYDLTTGLTYLRARYYDPAGARFLSPDPFGGTALLPLTAQKYLYAFNAPTDGTDPTGLTSLAEVLTTLFNMVGLFSLGQGVLGQARALVSGNWHLDGPNYTVSAEGSPLTGDLGGFLTVGHYTTQASTPPRSKSSIYTIALGLTEGTNYLSNFLKKKLGPVASLDRSGQANLFILTGLNPLGANIVKSSEDLLVPHWIATSPDTISAGVTGGYIAGNLDASSGPGAVLGAVISYLKKFISDPYSAFGVQFSFEGSSFGYSAPNSQLELNAGFGFSVSVGFSIGFKDEANVADNGERSKFL